MGERDGSDEALLVGIDRKEVRFPERLSLTPEQHQRLKNIVNADPLDAMKRASRRYLIVGSGSGEAGLRREMVTDWFDSRPNAVGIRLEDVDLATEDIDLWAPVFDILATQATWIVGVLENFDGGHVWELGYLYRVQTELRDVLWILKRVYEDRERMREEYDNGMAASHLKVLEEAVETRVLTWEDEGDLRRVVEDVP